jgi:hypothetical protein
MIILTLRHRLVWQFKSRLCVGNEPSTHGKVDTVDHIERAAGFFTASMPLAIDVPAAAGKRIKAKFQDDTTTCTSIQTHSVECYHFEQRISGL